MLLDLIKDSIENSNVRQIEIKKDLDGNMELFLDGKSGGIFLGDTTEPSEGLRTKECLYEETDYKKFILLENNRIIKDPHVQALKKSIQTKNLLHLQPIVINKDFEVYDGQHRITAAAELNVPIYYLIGDNLEDSDVHLLNANMKKWGIRDFIDYYVKKGNEDYILLDKFLTNNPLIKTTNSLLLLSTTIWDYSFRDIRAGNVRVTNYDSACTIAGYCVDIFKHWNYAFDPRFLIAMRFIHETGKYIHKKLLKNLIELKIEKQVIKLTYGNDYLEHMSEIEEIYNRYTDDENKVYFTKLYQTKVKREGREAFRKKRKILKENKINEQV